MRILLKEQTENDIFHLKSTINKQNQEKYVKKIGITSDLHMPDYFVIVYCRNKSKV